MKRSVAAVMLCVTIAGCSSTASTGPRPSTTPTSTPSGPSTIREAAAALAVADGHHADRGQPYVAPLRAIAKDCHLSSPAATLAVVNQSASRLAGGGLTVTRLITAQSLASAADHATGSCPRTFAQYLAQIVGTGPAKASSGWGGYGGSVTAWNAVHHVDPNHPGQYLPRRHNVDAYQLFSSGQVTSMVERFNPPVSADLALAEIVHDLLPGKVHSVYTLMTGQCQQAIYLGSELGGLLHSSSLGAFVELTSGGGVGHTKYDAQQVNRARITPLGAIGGQPCT